MVLPVLIFFAILCAVISLITACGNGLILYALLWKPILQTPSNLFIGSLATADIIIGTFVMPLAAINTLSGEWLFPNWVCTAWLCLDYVASSSSILNLMTMAIDRYFSIVAPIAYRSYRTHRNLSCVLVVVWACSIVYMLPIICWPFWYPEEAQKAQLGLPHNVIINNVTITSHNATLTQCNPGFYSHKQFKVISLVYSFIIPFITMCLVYVRIFVEIHRRTKRDIERKRQLTQNMKKHIGKEQPPERNDFQPLPVCNEGKKSPNLSERSAEHDKDQTYLHGIGIHDDANLAGNNEECVIPLQSSPNGARRASSDEHARGSEPMEVNPNNLMAPHAPVVRRLSWKLGKHVHSKNMERQREFRAAKKLAVIILAFCICWLPYMVLYVVVAHKPEQFQRGWHQTLFQTSIWLGYINSTINPFLYPLCIEDFRKALQPIIGIRVMQIFG